MARNRITKRTIDALQADGRDYVAWDGELTGFGVRVRPSGSKSFVVVYRTGGRNSPLRRVTVGAVGKIDVDVALKRGAFLPVRSLGRIVPATSQGHAPK